MENTARFRVVRRDIARILTLLNQRGETPVLPQTKTEKKAAKPAKKADAGEKKKTAKRAGAKKDKE